jgi:hypothetical protein
MSDLPPDDIDPFRFIDRIKMQKLLKKHRVKFEWTVIEEEYLNYIPPFNPKMFDGGDAFALIQLLYPTFYFYNSTVHTMKAEFIRWLKFYWPAFADEDPQQVLQNIDNALQAWNTANPLLQKTKVNWIPQYGGLLKAPVYDPTQEERGEMKDQGQNYPATDEEVTFVKK